MTRHNRLDKVEARLVPEPDRVTFSVCQLTWEAYKGMTLARLGRKGEAQATAPTQGARRPPSLGRNAAQGRCPTRGGATTAWPQHAYAYAADL
jgi:hypothetical protein